WLAAVRARETESRGKLDGFCASEQVPVAHYRLAAEIARVVTPETIVIGDGGDIVGCASKVVLLDRPGQWLDPGPLGCLGVGPSFALTAKLLHPGRRVLLIAGDGALGLNGMELETAVRLGLPLTVVVGNDGGWGQIRNPQLGFYGEARAVATSPTGSRRSARVCAGWSASRPRCSPRATSSSPRRGSRRPGSPRRQPGAGRSSTSCSTTRASTTARPTPWTRRTGSRSGRS